MKIDKTSYVQSIKKKKDKIKSKNYRPTERNQLAWLSNTLVQIFLTIVLTVFSG